MVLDKYFSLMEPDWTEVPWIKKIHTGW
jgi:hypothetical protein